MTQDAHLALVPTLIADFPRWLEFFEQHVPFAKPDQLALHCRTIHLRLAHRSVSAAVADPVFVESLYRTLKAWGIGFRASRLVSLENFGAALQTVVPELSDLESVRI